MDAKYQSSIRPILDTFDQITQLLREECIELPKIVVVGDQSSGKNSVLESITGISLPRGSGTVTRCPIIIQSRMVKSENDEGADISIEGTEERLSSISLDDLPKSIAVFQDKLIQMKNVEITDTPINIRLNKRNAPDLTLYDLPGITYKQGLTERIRDMISRYTAGNETIILMIQASNIDLCNTEALELIKQNSDFKERTMAVITKIDLGLQEKGLFHKLNSNELDLKYEPIVVRNRTQQEIDENESIESIRIKEMDLINNSELKKLSETSKGTSMLINFLLDKQREKIVSCKYGVREKILDQIQKLKTKLRSMPKPVVSMSEKMDTFKESLKKFADNFRDSLENRVLFLEEDENITYSVRALLEKDTKNKFQKYHGYFLSDQFFNSSQNLVNKARGFNLANFNEFTTFKAIITSVIAKIQIDDLLTDVLDLVLDLLIKYATKAFKYPDLCAAIIQEIKQFGNDQYEKAASLVNEFLSMEKAVVYTCNPYYMDMIDKVKVLRKKIEEDKKNSFSRLSLDAIEVEIEKFVRAHYDSDMSTMTMQISCFSYWKVFEKRFVDYLHMTIISKLLLDFRTLESIFDKKFAPNSNEHAFKWICEDHSVTLKREKLEKSLKAFEEANELIRKIC